MRHLLPMILMLAASGCGSATPMYDLDVSGNNLDHWTWVDGKPVVLRLFDGQKQAAKQQQAFVSGGSVEVKWTKVLAAKKSYLLRYYIDANNNGACDRDEPGFSLEIAAPTKNVALSLPEFDPAVQHDLCVYFAP